MALADSDSFARAIGAISPSDTEGLTQAVTDAMAANPRLAAPTPTGPGMRPNPAQGGSASGMAVLTPTDALGRIRQQTEKIRASRHECGWIQGSAVG
jgi:hypothetical protein